MLLFRGGRRREQLLLNGEVIEQGIAQVICSVLQLEDDFFKKLQIIPKQIDQIADEYREAIHNVYEHEKKAVSLKYLRMVKACLDSLLASGLDAEEGMITRLLIYLPCLEAHSQAYDASERLLAGKRYQSEMLNIFNASQGRDDPRVKEYKSAFNKGGHFHNASTAWKCFIDLLANNSEYGLWNITAEVVFDETEIYRGYAERFERAVGELWRLKKDLQYAWNEKDNNYTLSELKQRSAGPRVILSGDENVEVFPMNADFTQRGAVCGIISLTELVMAELNLLDEIDRPIRRCKLCGQLFVPYQKDSMFQLRFQFQCLRSPYLLLV